MISIRLATLMRERGLKMTDVARGAGVSRKTIWRYYHNLASAIELDVLNRLCAFLDVEPGDLLERKEEKHF